MNKENLKLEYYSKLPVAKEYIKTSLRELYDNVYTRDLPLMEKVLVKSNSSFCDWLLVLKISDNTIILEHLWCKDTTGKFLTTCNRAEGVLESFILEINMTSDVYSKIIEGYYSNEYLAMLPSSEFTDGKMVYRKKDLQLYDYLFVGRLGENFNKDIPKGVTKLIKN